MPRESGRRELPRILCRTAMAATATGAVIGGALAYHARYREPFAPVLERIEFSGFSTSKSTAPLRIGFVTDLHIGPAFRAVEAERALIQIAAAEPDLFLLGGDYACESPRYIAEAADLLSTYLSRARFGAFAVLGNHDYSNDAPRLTSHFERGGIRVLRNEAVPVSWDTNQLWIAGLDDAVLGRPDLPATYSQIPQGAKCVALWHEPDWAAHAAARGSLLQLSGHSHGGQVRLPLLGPLAAPVGGRLYVAGPNAIDGMTVYTSRGIGIYRPPVRFRCPPEVTLVTLR